MPVECGGGGTGGPGYWIASTKLADGTVLFKRFSVKTHGEDAAKELAIRERERQLQQVEHVMIRNLGALQFFPGRGANVDHSTAQRGTMSGVGRIARCVGDREAKNALVWVFNKSAMRG